MGVASPKASINRPMSREAGADDSRPRRASLMDMMSLGQSPVSQRSLSPTAFSPRAGSSSSESGIDNDNNCGGKGDGEPLVQSKEAIYEEFRYKATTSCSYVVNEMGLISHKDSDAYEGTDGGAAYAGHFTIPGPGSTGCGMAVLFAYDHLRLQSRRLRPSYLQD